jgi:hypothetical protein
MNLINCTSSCYGCSAVKIKYYFYYIIFCANFCGNVIGLNTVSYRIMRINKCRISNSSVSKVTKLWAGLRGSEARQGIFFISPQRADRP